MNHGGQKSLPTLPGYIADENPLAAQRVVEGIYDKTKILKSFPELGYKYRTEPRGEIGMLLYGHYRIAYFVKGDSVEIPGYFMDL